MALGTQPLPRLLEPAASKAADSTVCVSPFRSDHELLVVQEIRRRDYDEGRQMRVTLHDKAVANEQSRRGAP